MRDRAIVPGDQRPRLLFAEPDREHRAFAARAFVHEPRAQSTMIRAPFFQLKTPGDARRGDLADAMADDRRRLHAPRFPQLRQRDLHRENRRLRDLRAMHLRGLLGAAELFQKRETAPTAASPRRSAPSPRRKTGSCCISSRPMPHHCGPWPLMTKAMRGACSGRGVKDGADFHAVLLDARSASSSCISSPSSGATSVSRCG